MALVNLWVWWGFFFLIFLRLFCHQTKFALAQPSAQCRHLACYGQIPITFLLQAIVKHYKLDDSKIINTGVVTLHYNQNFNLNFHL